MISVCSNSIPYGCWAYFSAGITYHKWDISYFFSCNIKLLQGICLHNHYPPCDAWKRKNSIDIGKWQCFIKLFLCYKNNVFEGAVKHFKCGIFINVTSEGCYTVFVESNQLTQYGNTVVILTVFFSAVKWSQSEMVSKGDGLFVLSAEIVLIIFSSMLIPCAVYCCKLHVKNA